MVEGTMKNVDQIEKPLRIEGKRFIIDEKTKFPIIIILNTGYYRKEYRLNKTKNDKLILN